MHLTVQISEVREGIDVTMWHYISLYSQTFGFVNILNK